MANRRVLVSKRVIGWLLSVFLVHADLVLTTQRGVHSMSAEQEAADVIASSNFIQQITKESVKSLADEYRHGTLLSRLTDASAGKLLANTHRAVVTPPAHGLSKRSQEIAARKRFLVPEHLWCVKFVAPCAARVCASAFAGD